MKYLSAFNPGYKGKTRRYIFKEGFSSEDKFKEIIKFGKSLTRTELVSKFCFTQIFLIEYVWWNKNKILFFVLNFFLNCVVMLGCYQNKNTMKFYSKKISSIFGKQVSNRGQIQPFFVSTSGNFFQL